MRAFITFYATLFSVATCFAADVESPSRDLEKLQGRWERELKQNGQTYRVVKEIVDRVETVTIYDGPRIVHAHKVDFELIFTGDVRIMQWKNRVITVGNPKDRVKEGRFIYRLTDQHWIGVIGFLEGETQPVLVEVYQRAPSK